MEYIIKPTVYIMHNKPVSVLFTETVRVSK